MTEPARPLESNVICSCGTVMICPDIGCDRHKSSSESIVWIVTEYKRGGIRGVFVSQGDAEAEIVAICSEHRDLTRRDFIIAVQRVRVSIPSANTGPRMVTDGEVQRCGGTGMVAYWDGSAYAGEMCRGCVDCEGPDDPHDSACECDRHKSSSGSIPSAPGGADSPADDGARHKEQRMENNMVIGRMSIHDGFVAERTHDVEHPIRIGLSHGGDPLNPHTPVVWCELSESQCASIMAHIARRGETGDTYREALAFLSASGIEDESEKS